LAREQAPVHHFSHHLEAKRDLGSDRAWTRKLYAKRSRLSIDPIAFTLQIVMFFEGFRSKRQFIETAVRSDCDLEVLDLVCAWVIDRVAPYRPPTAEVMCNEVPPVG
jgi:hypothetical protein